MSGGEQDALQALRRLAGDKATGELVCASGRAEVHVHFQEGRVAWATSSAARFAFTRYVLEQCDIDREAFKELVHECRREKKPLGETLIEWGVATEEQVRRALQRQVEDALETLREGGPAQTVFLQRGDGYRAYNQAFTFALEDVCERPSKGSSQQRMPRISSAPPPPSLRERLIELLEHEGGIRWVEHHARGRVIDRLPNGNGAAAIESLTGDLFATDTDFVALRGAVDNLIGVDLGEVGSVWCGVDPQVVLGAMITALRERLRTESIARLSMPGGSMGAAKVSPDRGVSPQVLTEVIERTPALWGVALVDSDGQAHCLACREALDQDSIYARVRHLSRFLRGARDVAAGADGDPTFPRASMMAASPAGWAFGGEFLDQTRRDLWLILDPSAGQGLGWAILTALLRRTSLTSREVSR